MMLVRVRSSARLVCLGPWNPLARSQQEHQGEAGEADDQYRDKAPDEAAGEDPDCNRNDDPDREYQEFDPAT